MLMFVLLVVLKSKTKMKMETRKKKNRKRKNRKRKKKREKNRRKKVKTKLLWAFVEFGRRGTPLSLQLDAWKSVAKMRRTRSLSCPPLSSVLFPFPVREQRAGQEAVMES
jgi:hypothetical protein